MIKTKDKIQNHINSKTNLKDSIDLGKCIKIINSKKNYQVIGINTNKDICWVREWPLNFSGYKTFQLSMNKIILSTGCEIQDK